MREVLVAWMDLDVCVQGIIGLSAHDEGENDMAVRAEWLGEADGRSRLVPLRSSNGKATTTTLPRVIEWFAVVEGVDILAGCVQEIEGAAVHGRTHPVPFHQLIFLDQDEQTYAPSDALGKGIIEQHLPFFDRADRLKAFIRNLLILKAEGTQYPTDSTTNPHDAVWNL